MKSLKVNTKLFLGTIIPLITLLPMAKLLPKYSPILITLVNGIFDASMAMVSIPVKLYESGFSYVSVISIYFGSAVFFLLRIIFKQIVLDRKFDSHRFPVSFP